MAFSKLTDHLDELSDHIEAYLSNMVAYYKLDFFKKSMQGVSLLTKLLIAGSMFLFFLGFLSVAFAILIGKSIGSLSAGFFIIGGVYLLIFLFLAIYWKKLVEGIILEKFSKFIFNETEFGESVKEEVQEVENETPKPDHSWRTEF